MWKVKGWDKFVESHTRLLVSENYDLENKTTLSMWTNSKKNKKTSENKFKKYLVN